MSTTPETGTCNTADVDAAMERGHVGPKEIAAIRAARKADAGVCLASLCLGLDHDPYFGAQPCKPGQDCQAALIIGHSSRS